MKNVEPLLDGYDRHLRDRVDGVEVSLAAPSLEATLAAASERAEKADLHRRRRASVPTRRAVTALIAAASLLLLSATAYGWAQKDDASVRTSNHEDNRGGSTSAIPLLAPLGDLDRMVLTVGQDPMIVDDPRVSGTYQSFVAGSVGDPAQILTVISNRHGEPIVLPALLMNPRQVAKWFSEGTASFAREVTKVSTGTVRAIVTSASTSQDAAVESLPGEPTPPWLFALATDGETDVVLIGANVDHDELVDAVKAIRWSGSRAALGGTPKGFAPLGVMSRNPLISSAYSISAADGERVAVTRLADAGLAISSPVDSGERVPTVLRRGPRWAFDSGDAIVGIRDGAWVRVDGLGGQGADSANGTAAIDRLQELDRATFDAMANRALTEAAAATRKMAKEVVPTINALGRWLPRDVPAGTRLRTVAMTGGNSVVGVPGLEPLWSPTTGALVTFRLRDISDTHPRVAPTRSSATNGHFVEFADIEESHMVRVTIWPTLQRDVGEPVVAVAMFSSQDQIATVLASISNAAGGWSIAPVEGFETVAGVERAPSPQGVRGYFLEYDTFTAMVVEPDDTQPGAQLVQFLGMQPSQRTIDGEVAYVSRSGDGLRAVFLPSAGERPAITLMNGRLSLPQLIEVAKSFTQATEAELQTAVDNLSG